MATEFLGNHIEMRGGALSNVTKMEIFLRALSDPGFQQGVGVDVGVHQTTVSKVIKEVSQKIVLKKNAWISFPKNAREIELAKEGWTIPGAIGAIDCTHIRIMKPKLHGEEYFNRKGFCSINVQATCSSKGFFTSVDASWPGSVHDSRIWRNSEVHAFFPGNNNGAYLLGDEGYGIAPWLLVPYKNPSGADQRAYNKVHCNNRVKIECCFGQLKRRFPMLHYTLRLKSDRLCTFILAGFILHNVAKYLQDPDEDFGDIDDDEPPFCLPLQADGAPWVRHAGHQKRDAVAQQVLAEQR